MAPQINFRRMAVAMVVLGCASCSGQQTAQASVPGPASSPEHGGIASISEQSPAQRLPGSVSGIVSDQSGAVIGGARVRLTREGSSTSQEVISDKDGQFSFADIIPGSFQITITAAGFAPQTSSGMLHSGQNYIVLGASLAVASSVTNVDVGVSQVEVAEEQIKIEEKQRVLAIVPNFYVSYIPNAVPLTWKQKYKLAARTVVDPFTFLSVAGGAGIQQAQNHFKEYGQGTWGYARRFGAGYGDAVAGTFVGSAILPSLLKQDPRYFYKGTGSKMSRILYALANSVRCRGDNGRWQPNYSNILGNLAAGGISNLYYPPQDRDGVDLTFENAGIGIGATAVANIFQEFVVKKLTPKAKNVVNNP